MKNDSQVKYYARKLLAELKCERLKFEYSTDTLVIVALNGENVVKTYEVVDRPKFKESRRCVFDVANTKKEFDSVRSAAKYFGYSRNTLRYYMSHEKIFYETKKGRIVRFLGYRDEEK